MPHFSPKSAEPRWPAYVTLPPGFQPMGTAPLDEPVTIFCRDQWEPQQAFEVLAIYSPRYRDWVLFEDQDAFPHPPEGWRPLIAEGEARG